MPTGSHVIVCGAGPGGTATALLLARSGARVTLVEKVARPAPVGAALLLQPNGLAVLGALGLASALAGAGHRIPTMRVFGRNGRPISEVPIPDYGYGLDHVLAIRRADLDGLLTGAARRETAITTMRGAEVTGLGAGAEIQVRRGAETKTLTADLVIGADGIRSAVRTHGNFGARSTVNGLRYMRALVPAPPGLEVAEHWTALGLFGHSPLADGSAYWYADATHPAVAAALVAGDTTSFRELWTDHLPLTEDLVSGLDDLGQLLVNDVPTVRCRHFVDGPRALIGDAAHPMAPTLGQGANSAFVDAAVLTLELRQASDPLAGLRAYDQRRRLAVQRVQRDAHRVAKLSRGGSRMRHAARDGLMRRLSRPTASVRRFDHLQQEHPGSLYQQLTHTSTSTERGCLIQ